MTIHWLISSLLLLLPFRSFFRTCRGNPAPTSNTSITICQKRNKNIPTFSRNLSFLDRVAPEVELSLKLICAPLLNPKSVLFSPIFLVFLLDSNLQIQDGSSERFKASSLAGVYGIKIFSFLLQRYKQTLLFFNYSLFHS